MEGEIALPYYWAVPRQVAAGPYPGSTQEGACSAKLRTLLEGGVRAFVDLTEAGEANRLGPLRPYTGSLKQVSEELGVFATYRRFPVVDLSVPPPLTMLQVLDHVDEELHSGRPAYVHCVGGKGRTGTVVGCYLLRHSERLLPPEEQSVHQTVLDRIVRLKVVQGVPDPWESPQTISQFEFVRSWAEGA